MHREFIFFEDYISKSIWKSLLLKIRIIDQNPPGRHFLWILYTEIHLEVIIIENQDY